MKTEKLWSNFGVAHIKFRQIEMMDVPWRFESSIFTLAKKN